MRNLYESNSHFPQDYERHCAAIQQNVRISESILPSLEHIYTVNVWINTKYFASLVLLLRPISCIKCDSIGITGTTHDKSENGAKSTTIFNIQFEYTFNIVFYVVHRATYDRRGYHHRHTNSIHVNFTECNAVAAARHIRHSESI